MYKNPVNIIIFVKCFTVIMTFIYEFYFDYYHVVFNDMCGSFCVSPVDIIFSGLSLLLFLIILIFSTMLLF